MTTNTSERTAPTEHRADVTVIGAGLSGLAAAIHLAQSGLAVVCLEPDTAFHHVVGESLDWSAPELFKGLGFPMTDLVASGISTYKKHVVIQLKSGSVVEYIPSAWLGRAPFHIELRTIHVDREQLHEQLLHLATTCGVKLICDRALKVATHKGQISSVSTQRGDRFISPWFLDASGGSSSFLARELNLESVVYGPKKVAMWSYLSTSDWQEGTTIYAEGKPGSYMDWIWEIPINPGKISVGYVSTGKAVKEQRAQGLSVEEIFRGHLAMFPRFQSLLREANLPAPSITSFLCRVYKGVCGSNWVILGEAASQPDPITGNGVTAALRHAAEASRLILRFRTEKRISKWARASYNLRVLQMGMFFNSLIEKIAYQAPVRDRFGLLTAGDIYTIPAWSINQIYSQLSPDGMFSTILLTLLLSLLRGASWLFYQVCRSEPLETYASADERS